MDPNINHMNGKVLNDFGSKYTESRLFKEHMKDPAQKKNGEHKQYKNTMVQCAVDDITPKENEKTN